MKPSKYEQHTRIKKNQLCPMILHTSILPTHVFTTNWHKNIELILVIDGEAEMSYETDVFQLKPHDLIVINSEVIHHISTPTTISYYSMIIDEKFALENGVDTSSYYFTPRIYSNEITDLFLQVVDGWNTFWETQAPLDAAILRRNLLSLLVALCSNFGTCKEITYAPQNPAEKHVAKAIHYININYAKPIHLDNLAEHVGINKCYLAREFKKYTSLTISRYINMTRCKVATDYISNGMSIKEAAFTCGFENVSYFSKIYKDIMKQAPSCITPNKSRT